MFAGSLLCCVCLIQSSGSVIQGYGLDTCNTQGETMQRFRSDVWILEGRYLLLTLLSGVLDTHGETMPRLRLTIGCFSGVLEVWCLLVTLLSVESGTCNAGVLAWSPCNEQDLFDNSDLLLVARVLAFLLVNVRLIRGSNAWMSGPCKTLVLIETAEAQSHYLLVGFPMFTFWPFALCLICLKKFSWNMRKRQCTEGRAEGWLVGQNCNMWTFPRTVEGVEVGHV